MSWSHWLFWHSLSGTRLKLLHGCWLAPGLISKVRINPGGRYFHRGDFEV
ncbi:hypothetical protein CLIM01_14322 [Colletotrichum limetticola]|uniref:Uncharacterized protein n=1 Tax=Colletotrichum limetticola TaxID=1209924 RepID=A0ABQ9P9I4_9PEZI|nr:hypothetical protein CLIM01_14322 [Colletotrichum limetticola]